jgi:hypothetical protein
MASINTPIGMLSFPSIFQAKATTFNAEPRFSASLIFDPAAQRTPEYAALKKAAFETGIAKWGADKMKDPNFIRTLRLPFRDAGEKEYAGYTEGHTFVQAWSKNRPGIVDARLQDITVPDDVWPGQLARFDVSPFAYDVTGNKGIAFGLSAIQITKRDMPRLDGRRAANKAFGAVEEEGAEAMADPFA